jgi:hypothetical protein
MYKQLSRKVGQTLNLKKANRNQANRNQANRIRGYTDETPSGSQSPTEGNPPAALSQRLRGLKKNEVKLHTTIYTLCLGNLG